MPPSIDTDDCEAPNEGFLEQAMAIGPGQPPALLQAMGRRTDWTNLRIYDALLIVLSDAFNQP